MKVKVVIPLDDGGRKKVDQYRFQFDRKLIKVFEPAIELIPPINYFDNIRNIINNFNNIMHGLKRFKVKIDKIVTDIPEENALSFTIEEDKSINMLIHKLLRSNYFVENESQNFVPYILIYNNGDKNESESIYDSIVIDNFKHDFFVSQILLIMQDKTKSWDIITECSL